MKQIFAKIKRTTSVFSTPKNTPPSTTFTCEFPRVEERVINHSTLSQSTKKRHRPRMYNNPPGRLESLPPEVRRHLLCILDLPELKGLIHASPIFHRQYVYDRRYILYNRLDTTLGNVVGDAYAVLVSREPGRGAEAKATEIIESNPTKIVRADDIDFSEVQKVASYYIHVVRPMIRHFSRSVMEEFIRRTGLSGHKDRQLDSQDELSAMEMIRFTRAIYRFQFICHIANSESRGANVDETVKRLFDAVQAWEAQELIICCRFAEDMYERLLLQDVYWDFHQDNPKFDDQRRPPTPEGAFDLTHENFMYLPGTLASGGIPLLELYLSSGSKDHERLVRAAQPHIRSGSFDFEHCLFMYRDSYEEYRHENCPSERDLMTRDKVPFPFRGDGEFDAPPIAWTYVWRDTYCNLAAEIYSKDLFSWGYVFWDAKRMKRGGGMQLLDDVRQEMTSWDPRDDMRLKDEVDTLGLG